MHDGGEDRDGRGRRLMAVAGGGGVGDDADPVVVPAAHADVEVLAGGGAVGEEDSAVDGDAFGFVDGDGVSQCDVFGGVVGGEDNAAPSVEVGDDQGAVVSAGIDVPAVAVADPEPAAGDEAAIVAGGDDLVAAADDLVADGESVGFDFAGGERSARARRARASTVAWPAAMTTIDSPAARAARQWAKASSTMASREPPAMRPWAS